MTTDTATATATEYRPVDVTDARPGDELDQAGTWHTVARVSYSRDGRTVSLGWAAGGAHTFPVSHKPRMRRAVEVPATEYRVSRLGNGTALHLADARGILCNRWGSTNGTVQGLKLVTGAAATCKRCLKLAATTGAV